MCHFLSTTCEADDAVKLLSTVPQLNTAPQLNIGWTSGKSMLCCWQQMSLLPKLHQQLRKATNKGSPTQTAIFTVTSTYKISPKSSSKIPPSRRVHLDVSSTSPFAPFRGGIPHDSTFPDTNLPFGWHAQHEVGGWQSGPETRRRWENNHENLTTTTWPRFLPPPKKKKT